MAPEGGAMRWKIATRAFHCGNYKLNGCDYGIEIAATVVATAQMNIAYPMQVSALDLALRFWQRMPSNECIAWIN